VENLYPGPGADRVFGGPGPDDVYVDRDGRRDVIRCGPGLDHVFYDTAPDRRDVLFSCKRISDPA
jgi:hypothetical protein